MANSISLGLGRRNILKVYKVESDKVDKQDKPLIGTVINTTQIYEYMKQLRGLAPAMLTPEGESASYDDYAVIFTQKFIPTLFTKGLRYTKLFDFTNQYKDVIGKQKDFARSFGERRNIVAATVHNVGFTDTTYGMNSEVLYSTSHSMGSGLTFANRPTTDVAFGPLAVQQMLVEIRKQKGATNLPMNLTGKVQLTVPVALEPAGIEVVKSLQLANTNNNNTNQFVKDRIELFVGDYLSSDTAFFGKMVDDTKHGLFILDQMPYDMEQLAMTDDFMYRWVASESYTAGWYDAHGTWGTTGV